MPSLDITDDHHDRITALREELADAHADSYTSVTLLDTLAYLLDLADAVDDPEREADVASAADGDDADPFPRDKLEARLSERNRRHSDADAETPMDLYTIAAEYDISGRSNMTKQELVTAILDATERRYTDPLAPVDVDFPDPDSDAASEANHANAADSDADTESDVDGDDSAGDDGSDGDASDDGQLNAMLSLLETHSDKWHSADGDARYEVELPDGSVESARTKDDVRATLFKHY
ncbi:hypothetical protein HKK80_06840 [Halonotius sp. F2-221B]|uniref:Rho termination factor N-terminal domain-containing protein n=1 Tax=Halonotius sp. F2-221B TaxID=2731620 RepID=UPI00398BA740